VFRTCDVDMCVFLMFVFTSHSGVGYAVFTVCMFVHSVAVVYAVKTLGINTLLKFTFRKCVQIQNL